MLWLLAIICILLCGMWFFLNLTLESIGNRIVRAVNELQLEVRAAHQTLQDLKSKTSPAQANPISDELARHTRLLEQILYDGIDENARAHRRQREQQQRAEAWPNASQAEREAATRWVREDAIKRERSREGETDG